MNEIISQPEPEMIETADAAPNRGALGILLAAAISIEGFALITLLFQVLGWGDISGWGWLGALVQVALLLAIAIVTPLLIGDLFSRLHIPPSPDPRENEMPNPPSQA
jgi:hypothetical protein